MNDLHELPPLHPRPAYEDSTMHITFADEPPVYDGGDLAIHFTALVDGNAVVCSISAEALEDHFGANNLDKEGRIEAFRKNRSNIERLLRTKYLSWPVEEPEFVLLKTEDVPKLLETPP